MKKNGNLYHKIENIEYNILKNSEMLKESLSIGRQHQFVFENGIMGLRRKIIGDYKLKERSTPIEALYTQIRQDKALRHPHRKILDYLIDRFDYQAGSFREAHFSKIVKECRLGKNMAKQYLEFLISRGYLKKRSDGYRVWYSIKAINV